MTRRSILGQKDKLIERLKTRPKDFTYDEAAGLLKYFGYKEFNKGKTSGSRVKFECDEYPPIILHNPHPRSTLPGYQVKQLIETLEKEGLI